MKQSETKMLATPPEQPAARQAMQNRVIKLAQSWAGTPYHHQQSVKGAGCDCLGLVRGVYEALYHQSTKIHTPYTRDWAEASGEESLIQAARDHLLEVASGNVGQGHHADHSPQRPKPHHQPGDVLIFRFRKWMIAKHAAIQTSEQQMIHAIEGAPVTEVSLSPWWRRHIAAVFRFPLPPAASISREAGEAPLTNSGADRGNTRI